MDAVETVNHFIVLSQVFNSFGVQPDEGLADRLPKDVPYRIAVPMREPPLAKARVEPMRGAASLSAARSQISQAQRALEPRQTFINRNSKLTPRHRRC
jgi:hypothetical protein